MANPTGQADFQSAGQSKGFMVNPLLETKMFHEARVKSVVGKLASFVDDQGQGLGPEAAKGELPMTVMLSKLITTGDEYRFHLEQNLSGAVSFGDNRPKAGDYTAYLNARLFLNQIKSAVFPIPEAMSRQRMAGVISEGEFPANLKRQIETWFAEQYTLDFYSSLLRGASNNLMAPVAIGGRALDMGLGAGVQISPAHFIAAGNNGFVSGVSGTPTYETNMISAVSSLVDSDDHRISRRFIFDLAHGAMQDFQILPSLPGEKYAVACDPALLADLKVPGGAYYDDLKKGMERGASNPIFNNQEIQLDSFVFFPDPWLKKFRPKIVSNALVWGQNEADWSNDKRRFTSDSNVGLMAFLGSTAMLEATNGAVKITTDAGFHEDGATWGGRLKDAFMRTRWTPQDGRALAADTLIERGLVVAGFYTSGPKY